MNTSILFTGGGTLGSVTPLLAVAAELRRRRPDWTQSWVGTADGPEVELVKPTMAFQSLPSIKLRRYWSTRTLTDAFRFPGVLLAANRIVRARRPSVVVSAGGYVSVPIVWAAKYHRAKVLIHQQDVQRGLANRMLAGLADQITVAFATSVNDFPRRKTVWTGNPVRAEILQGDPGRGREVFQLPSNRRIIVVLGGGTGATALNRLANEIRPLLPADVTLVHLTGPQRGVASMTTTNYLSRPFVTEHIGDLFAAADIVITRAGLGTMTELSALQKTCIVIPMPDTHQEENAAALEASQAAIVRDQRTLTGESLAADLIALLADTNRRQQLGRRLGEWNKPNASSTIATLIERLVV